MKIKVSKTNVEYLETEISLPHYRCGEIHFYKVYSETKAIQVLDYSHGLGIQTIHVDLAFNEPECTEEQFMEAYNRVKSKLDKL